MISAALLFFVLRAIYGASPLVDFGIIEIPSSYMIYGLPSVAFVLETYFFWLPKRSSSALDKLNELERLCAIDGVPTDFSALRKTLLNRLSHEKNGIPLRPAV